ncbi:MAG: ADP-ribosyltransferase [Aerococcus sp.]|nr:ADP-ribosyltransferase [Aerococcus sp.]
MTEKFISTSVTTKGAFTGRPNVVIVVPRGSNGAYIEQLSDKRYRRQREFLLGKNVELKQISIRDEVVYYEAVENHE